MSKTRVKRAIEAADIQLSYSLLPPEGLRPSFEPFKKGHRKAEYTEVHLAQNMIRGKKRPYECYDACVNPAEMHVSVSPEETHLMLFPDRSDFKAFEYLRQNFRLKKKRTSKPFSFSQKSTLSKAVTRQIFTPVILVPISWTTFQPGEDERAFFNSYLFKSDSAYIGFVNYKIAFAEYCPTKAKSPFMLQRIQSPEHNEILWHSLTLRELGKRYQVAQREQAVASDISFEFRHINEGRALAKRDTTLPDIQRLLMVRCKHFGSLHSLFSVDGAGAPSAKKGKQHSRKRLSRKPILTLTHPLYCEQYPGYSVPNDPNSVSQADTMTELSASAPAPSASEPAFSASASTEFNVKAFTKEAVSLLSRLSLFAGLAGQIESLEGRAVEVLESLRKGRD